MMTEEECWVDGVRYVAVDAPGPDPCTGCAFRRPQIANHGERTDGCRKASACLRAFREDHRQIVWKRRST